ncbi:MAG: Eco57I restriction-modification methylase domain-containing protein [Flavobacteriales bacterium]|nr:Eco57I restriction-modification methylase domain-containing protein [Flavobacteriales bacterium]
MSLFQSAVLNKYLKDQNDARVAAAYATFTAHFHDPSIQANIREAKEEQYQEGFLRDLFVNVLGYTLNPQKDYELTSEFKNEKGAKKADGAILQKGKALAVIELKGTDTTDLQTINTQAFNYKANHTDCVYVITSNFHKLRFFIDNAVEHIEWDLFTLNAEGFRLLWLCLQRDNLLSGIPKKVKAESLQQEEKITKLLYKDYSTFKNALWQDLCTNHPEHDKLVLYKKSQKLLDRFLFVLFSEDKGLLPPNTLRGILEQWRKLTELDEYRPLYERCQKYFGWLNAGYKSSTQEIFAYNGGLFKPDELLDSVRISDAILETHLTALHAYDFGSEVDVNILGHIFEHSLNEIENITAQLEGRAVDSKKTKRKKDGVFYTPKYITQYIVEHTVGRLCTEKKDELGVLDEEYAKGRKGRQKKTIQELDTKLDVYRDWLLSLTICDPACGSGAFLNQALDFLIAEHRYVDELQASLLGHSITFKDIGDHILERNIFGVDINEESVEIARLSLWLRTATKGRKLNDLSSNIKCGNSLIDDPAVAGDKAFDWKKEFPQVFAKGGFDVVIGNPPYVRQELIKPFSASLEAGYQVFSGKADLFTYFYELAYRILSPHGLLSFISSGKFFQASYGTPLVTFLTKRFRFIEVVDFDDLDVFEGISAYPLIFTGRKEEEPKNYEFAYAFVPDLIYHSLAELMGALPYDSIRMVDFIANDFSFHTPIEAALINKLSYGSIYLKDLGLLPLVGIKTGYNEGYLTTASTQATIKPYIFGKDIKRYTRPMAETQVIFPYERRDGEYTLPNEEELGIALHTLQLQRGRLETRAIICDGVKNGSKIWYEYQQINRKLDFDQEYIVYPNVSLGANYTLSRSCVLDMTGFVIPTNDLYILALLNSALLQFVMSKLAITRRGGYQEYKVQYIQKLPIKKLKDSDKSPFKIKAEAALNYATQLNELSIRFTTLLLSKYTLPKLSRNLENWPVLDFKGFLKELKKANVTLTLAEEAEWLGYFTEQQTKARALQTQIDKTDKEIDALVYQLYGLTEEEVRVVEGR